jgi:hypothetical protein
MLVTTLSPSEMVPGNPETYVLSEETAPYEQDNRLENEQPQRGKDETIAQSSR